MTEESTTAAALARVSVRLDTVLEDIAELKADVRETVATRYQVAALAQRLEAIDAWRVWALRIVLGAVLTAAMSGLLITRIT